MPDSHGAPARLVVTLDLRALVAGVRHHAAQASLTGVTGDGLDLPPAAPFPAAPDRR